MVWPRDISPKPQKRAAAHPTTIRMSGYETGIGQSERHLQSRLADRVDGDSPSASACLCVSVEGWGIFSRSPSSPRSARTAAAKFCATKSLSLSLIPPNVVDGLPDSLSQVRAFGICIRSIVGQGEIKLQNLGGKGLDRGVQSCIDAVRRPDQGGPWSAPRAASGGRRPRRPCHAGRRS